MDDKVYCASLQAITNITTEISAKYGTWTFDDELNCQWNNTARTRKGWGGEGRHVRRLLALTCISSLGRVATHCPVDAELPRAGNYSPLVIWRSLVRDRECACSFAAPWSAGFLGTAWLIRCSFFSYNRKGGKQLAIWPNFSVVSSLPTFPNTRNLCSREALELPFACWAVHSRRRGRS